MSTPRKVPLEHIGGGYPRPLDVIHTVEYEDGTMVAYSAPWEEFHARRLIAMPRTLIKWALQIAWMDFKAMVRGKPKRPIETVRDALGGLK